MKVSIERGFWKIPKKIAYSRAQKGAVMYLESWYLCPLHHLSYGVNSNNTQTQLNILPKNDNSNAKIVCLLLQQYLY